MESKADSDLLCVGCGRAVARERPGQTLAIACACGAGAPILHRGNVQQSAALFGEGWHTPLSLVRASALGTVPSHLEYYLGFSDHQSPLKTEVTRALRAMGSISFRECPDARCRAAYERSIERRKYWEGRSDGSPA